LFSEANFRHKVKQECKNDGSDATKGTISISYPYYNVPCVLSDIFAFNYDGKVIEAFKPTLTETDVTKTYLQNLVLSNVNDYGCE